MSIYTFSKTPVSELSHRKKYGFIITNPPYGEKARRKEVLQKFTKKWQMHLTS